MALLGSVVPIAYSMGSAIAVFAIRPDPLIALLGAWTSEGGKPSAEERENWEEVKRTLDAVRPGGQKLFP